MRVYIAGPITGIMDYKEFKTPDRHYCKKNPELKNCFTCKNLKGWLESEESTPIYFESETHYSRYPNYPDCAADVGDGWDIEIIKSCNYNMQCEKWEAFQYIIC